MSAAAFAEGDRMPEEIKEDVMTTEAKLTLEQWRARYIARIVERAELSEEEAAEVYEGIDDKEEQLEYDPEWAADSEMSYWDE
jgi:hypothetical protein